jgi:anti-sigma factor ChrR (cupin superfamily)
MPKRTHIREIEEQAALYALGALPGEEAARFKTRLAAGCPLCRSAFAECQGTVSVLPLAAPEMEPPAGLRGRLMERIGVTETAPEPPAAMGTIVRPEDTAWENTPVPGVEIRPLLGRKTILVRMAPGTMLPPHEHRTAEQCLVLEGSVRSDDITAHAGDFTFMPAGSRHSQLSTETGCLLLITYT